MLNYEFGQLVLSDTSPTLSQRENVARKQLADWHYKGSYIRVHAVLVNSSSAFYAAVSFARNGVRVLSYVAGTIKCRRKGDGYWLGFDCFIATGSMPHTLTDCPREIFVAGEATKLESDVDQSWYQSCYLSQKDRDTVKAMRKGMIFKVATDAPAKLIAGERATYVLILNKRKALYIAPECGATVEGDTDLIVANYNLVPGASVPTYTDVSGYSETGELLFDLTGATPTLKGRLAAGAKAKLIEKQRTERDMAHAAAIQHYAFAERFTSGTWMT